jgi:protocatechuate 3,4-dioxygenase alpha subunit
MTPLNDEPARLTATPSQTVGPFFHVGISPSTRLSCLFDADTKGERITLRIRVLDGDGLPVPDALIEVWQADADGRYVRPDRAADAPEPSGFCGFGRLATDPDGVCTFETIHPGRVADADGRRQAPHVNVCLFARGLLRQIFTRIYFAGDEGLSDDAVLALVPESRRSTLIASRGEGRWSIDIRLQGEGETVFFDL